MGHSMTDAISIDLLDPRAYGEGVPHDQLRWLRENHPVYWHDEPGGAGFWVLTSHRDVKEMEQDSETFSSEPSTALSDDSKMGDENHRHLIMSDPPHHTQHRKFLGEEFTLSHVRTMREQMASLVDQIIDEVIEKGQCDVVADLGRKLASHVTADLLGLDRLECMELCDAVFVTSRGASKREGEGLTAVNTMLAHALTAWDKRFHEPRSDMLSRIAHGEVGGCPVDQLQFSIDFHVLVSAGVDTARNVVALGLETLLEHPDQLEMLWSDEELVPGAVEEMLRWVPPILYQRRTATRDTEIGGLPIARGQKLLGFYVAANRDPEVFSDPEKFDIRRRPNPHLAFGSGRHFCLGSHLARLELNVMFRALIGRIRDIERVGPTVWQELSIAPPPLHGPVSLPIRFRPGPRVGFI